MRNKARLSRDDWVRAGLKRLARDGIDAVRIEVLARDLGVSKGGFYWQFADRDELLTAMLHAWEAQNTVRMLADVQRRPPGQRRLERLISLVAGKVRGRLDMAVREWGRRDARVAERVGAVEAERLKHLTSLLREIGFGPEEARERAEIAYFAYLGFIDRALRDPDLNERAPRLAKHLVAMLLHPQLGTPLSQ